MLFFGVCFFLYFIKLPAGNGFLSAYKPSVFPPIFFQNRIRFTYRRSTYMQGNRVIQFSTRRCSHIQQGKEISKE